MATRINKAKNFNGKSYVVTDEITSIINSLKFENGALSFTGGKVQDENGVGATSTAVDLSSLIDFITSGKVGGKIITTDSEGNFAYVNAVTDTVHSSGSTVSGAIPTEEAVRTAIDAVQSQAISVIGGNGIVVSGNGTEKTVTADIKLEKLGTATAGYASSYRLMVKNADYDPEDAQSAEYIAASGDVINIPKDQFLNDATFVASASAEEATAYGVTAGNPFIKLDFAINTKDASGAETQTSKVIGVEVTNLVDIYTSGNGIDITNNVVTAVVDDTDTVYAAKGSATSVMSVTSEGIKATGIQAAIDLAAGNVYDKTSTAISAVNTKVEAFETSVNTNVSAAIVSVNGKVDSAVANVNTAVGTAVSAVNGKVDGAVTAVNTAVTSTVANVNTAVGTAVSAVDGKVDGAVSAVNTAVTSTVANVNTAVGTAVSAVDGKVDGAVSAVNAAIVSTVADINTNVSAVASQVVQIVDNEYIISAGNIVSTTSAQTVTLTGITGKVLAVYGADGVQIYPEIKKVGSTYTLTAEYGPSDTIDSAWSVLHTSAVTYTAVTAASATAPAAVTYSDASAVDATAPAAVTYSDASAVDATAPAAVTYSDADDGADASYTNASYDETTSVGALDYKQA